MMELVRLRFEATVTERGQLPRFFGPTLRGALGSTFWRMVCVTHMPECAPCPLRDQCPYPRFFEPFAPSDHPFAKRLAQMPRPFALQIPPPAAAPVTFQIGDRFVFRLTLWHHIPVLLPYLTVAVQRTLDKGLGKGMKARLERIVAEHPDGDALVFAAEEGLVRTKVPTVSIEEAMAQPSFPDDVPLTIRFLSPVRIDIGGKLQNPLTFSALIKAANERGRALFWAYREAEPPWDGKALVHLAEQMKPIASEQTWVDFQRFSRRQKERLKVGGVVGWMRFAGADLLPFLPLLRLMAWVNIGKLTTMGLGQIALESAEGR